MSPSLELGLVNPREAYRPGDRLTFRYEVDDAEELNAVEASILWYTEGKGDEDLGVHFFERRTLDSHDDLRGPTTVEVVLPNSPLSYEGQIVKIRWCARVRVFPRKGRPYHEEASFRLLNRRSSE